MKSLILKPFEARGVCDGSITQIVRVAKLPHQNPLGVWEAMTFGGPNGGKTRDGKTIPEQGAIGHTRTGHIIGSPFGHPGELLCGKEEYKRNDARMPPGITYRAGIGASTVSLAVWLDGTEPAGMREAVEKMSYSKGWRQAKTMPEWASRIALKNAGVRVERVQECSKADALKRITRHSTMNDPRREFQWEFEENFPGAWERNDWVFVLDIERVKP
jgi:hypothetical protein